MKFLTSSLAAYKKGESRHRNLRLLGRFFLTLVALVIIFSVVFHVLMAWEGQEHSWLTGFYWSLTVMSTLGFGDITFHSDIGRLFSILVLLSGVIFLLILLPFTLIEFFYAPWVESRTKRIVRDRLPESVSGHVVLLNHDSVSATLIEKLDRHGIPYALLTPETDECLQLTDIGINAFAGDPSQAESYERLRLEHASIVALTGNDFENARHAFKIRSLHEKIPIISAADSKSSSEVIRLSGANKAFQLANIIGEALARRTIGGSSLHHVVANFDELLIAEALADSPELVGKTLAEANLRKNAGINVIGIWERGDFTTARPDAVIHANTVLLLAGSEAQLELFDQRYRNTSRDEGHVIVIGAGRVGTAVCKTLDARDTDYRVIDRSARATKQFGSRAITGDASHFETLHSAGIIDARSVIITSHNDDLEVYLTIFCRKLRPDIQIVCRASEYKTIGELHQAGADIVLSYASIGANIIFNFLKHSDILMVAEGLNIFKVQAPPSLHGRTLAEEDLRAKIGCNVIAVRSESGLQAPPRPREPLSAEDELILIGDTDSEKRFFEYLNALPEPQKS
ncbi:NAD-binding protein [Pelagicoccus sp. NFK12]|uniref:NAD-binding protein n=1 Tax=Pelagicoccus enzymogenes TaxID=2773457 RepID=A0A927IIV0_9BACT|nr:NAD-binding protein [Pelagicoccus enzymogenes]MBD5781214.1 NAD-binding protein [Pelagicoccus enzymogenes]MDQ8198884.1 NAD-binding protein [Pelagicoccus enzymogenes]